MAVRPQIYFNNSRVICGALIQTYLLEKSRVTHQLAGERNYHIFYQVSVHRADSGHRNYELIVEYAALHDALTGSKVSAMR